MDGFCRVGGLRGRWLGRVGSLSFCRVGFFDFLRSLVLCMAS